ncbi:MAG TPA: CHASE4 domain-containing protein [Vicinamibacterales bacterium]|nr:CHASE4 domain-containing protein [Vicinamibacterales bacterium]
MTLRGRTLLIVGSAMLLLLVGQYAGLRYAFLRALTEIENDRVRQQVTQARGEIRKEISNIDSVAADYAAWDKTYAFVARPNREFPQSDLADEALRRLRLDAVLIVNTAGREVLFRTLRSDAEVQPIHAALLEQVRPGTPLVTFSDTDASHQGLIEANGTPIALAIRPVLTSEGTGPGRGVLLMARRLDETEVRRIGDTIHLSIEIRPVANAVSSPTDEEATVEVLGSNQIAGELFLGDIRDNVRWSLRVVSDRPLHVQAERWFVYFILMFLVSVAVVAAVTLVLLDRTVLRRLSSMSRAVATIAQTGDLTQQVNTGGADELAAVGAAIDHMLERIRESHEAADRASSEASRLKSEFLAHMSHEIRTPLNGVLGTFRILEDSRLDADQRRLVETGVSSAEGLLGILNDVLDLSKIEAGKMTLVDEPFDLRATAEAVLALFAPLRGDKPIDLLLKADPRLPARLVGDEGRVRQVIVNLVGNAVKFTQSGHVLVDLSSESDDSGSWAIVRVSDTGMGIAAEKLSAIFDSFTQADVTTTRRFGGSGLGLTITRKLVDLMGGSVSVTSEVGKGSTFTCRLPARPAPDLSQPLRWTGDVVLIDRPGLRRSVYSQTLRDLGASVTEVATPAEALAVPAPSSNMAVVAITPAASAEVETQFATLVVRGHRLLVVVRSRQAAVPRAGGPVVVLVEPIGCEQWHRALAGADDLPHHASPQIADCNLSGRVLLAEDNRVNQLVAVGLLEKLGCTVDAAATGTEAIGLARQNDYDVVLMDCEMPEMDGYEASRRIRTELGNTRVPIVALTAHAISEARERCLAAGMNDFLTKPLRLDDLRAMLQKHLDRPQARAAS